MNVQLLPGSSRAATLALAALSLMLGACRAAPERPDASDVAAIEHMVDDLYRCFCFDAGGQADWDGMRAHFAEGASFVASIRDDSTPRAVGVNEFLRDFKSWIDGSPIGQAGLHERVVHTRIDLFGNVAHAYVTFEGFTPPHGETQTRGIDSIQLVRQGQRWLVASFTTQHASEGRPIPARFER